MIKHCDWATALGSRRKRIILVEKYIQKFEQSHDARTLP